MQHFCGQAQTAHSEQVGLAVMMCECLFKPFLSPQTGAPGTVIIPYLPLVIPFQHLSSDAELAMTFLLHRLLGRVIQYVLRAVRFPLASKTCKQRGCSGPRELLGAPRQREVQGFCLFFVLPSQNLFSCKQGCIINLALKINHQPKCPRLKVTGQGLF